MQIRCRQQQEFCRQKFTKRRKLQHNSTVVVSDDTSTKAFATLPVITLLLALLIAPQQPALVDGQQLPLQQPQVSSNSEYLIVGQAGQQVHLPCLIGRKLYCGEPYLIAWYKRNLSSNQRDWQRIEYKKLNEAEEDTTNEQQQQQQPSTGFRARFEWPRQTGGESNSCEQLAMASNLSPQVRLKLEANFDCTQLTIDKLELRDEGQYRCEITFMESLDMERCPATTLSQLSVIAQPGPPDLLVNGRQVQWYQVSFSVKEGGQVRLECQSSGGRPAPRIEWLNISHPLTAQTTNKQQPPLQLQLHLDSEDTQVRLMRSQWPQKRTSTLQTDSGMSLLANQLTSTTLNGSLSQQTPVLPLTSSSITFSLSRYDLQSQFACLVLPQQLNANALNDQLIKSYLMAAVLNQQQQQPRTGAGIDSTTGAMLRWTKLDVQVKPSSVSIEVREAISEQLLVPIEPQMRHLQTSSTQVPPVYSLQPNQLYAVQCIVEGSRPQSRLTWFNRTSAITLEPQVVEKRDFLLPTNTKETMSKTAHHHRLSSFERTLSQQDGTFRTTNTLLLSTSVYDNLDELFCKVSNEAFQFDELSQVAPIISAQLYVNYAPLAWLEFSSGSSHLQETLQQQQRKSSSEGKAFATLTLKQSAQLNLRCFVAANPLNQNVILQIEWLKDNRKLLVSPERTQQQQRIHIERANHLHMTTQAPQRTGNTNQLTSSAAVQAAANNRLLISSQLTIRTLTKSDSGAYTCHFKLIPAPAAPSTNHLLAGGIQLQQQQQQRITSGQANQTIQVNVIEAKPKAPILKILSSSSSGLLVYAARRSPPVGERRDAHLITVVAPSKRNLQLTLKCQFSTAQQVVDTLSHKVTWYLNGQYLYSTSAAQTDTYNLSLSELSSSSSSGNGDERMLAGGLLTCAHHIMGPTSSPNNFHGGLMRVYQSLNAINLKRRVAPKLLTRSRELMPKLRSFSELELNAHPANRLTLTCLARCEPLCSIGWHLNGKPLSLEALNGGPVQVEEQLAADLLPFAAAATSAAAAVDNQQRMTIFAQRLRLSRQQQTDDMKLNALSGVEHLIYQDSNNSIADFAWLRETYLGPTDSSTSSSSSSADQWLKRNNKPLLPELHRHLQQTERSGIAVAETANVVSKLELSYNQLSQLLQTNDELLLKCKLVPLLNTAHNFNGNVAATATAAAQPLATGFFQYAHLEAERWFPTEDETNGSSASDTYRSEDGYEEQLERESSELNSTRSFDAATAATDYRSYPFAASNEPLNLTELQIEGNNNNNNNNQDDVELDNEQRQLLKSQLQLPAKKVQSLQTEIINGNDLLVQDSATAADEMQISILLDREPKSARLTFAGVESNEQETATVTLSEKQLLELTDPNKPLPLLQCQSPSKAYPAPQFRWTFTDLNHTFYPIGSEETQLNLRHFIEFRQRQFNVDPMSAYGVDVLANIAGNYTCTVSNIHGSSSASLELSIQGRPICKLSLGNEYLSSQNELMVNLRCSIYSKPTLLETIWFRNNQPLSTNRSNVLISQPIMSIVEQPVMILNKQQDFMLSDLMTQSGNFKCIARNSMGFSESCELKQSDKQLLFRTFKPLTQSVGDVKTALSMMSASLNNKPVNYLANNSINHLEVTSELPFWKGVFAHLDWLLMIGCALALIWLVFIIVNSVLRRRFRDLRKLRLKPIKQNTNWRFNNNSRTTSNNQIVEAPFSHSSKMCVNYYGGSNGCDSEHDMIQSCSQSSHYEDFNHHQQSQQIHQQRTLTQQQQQQQPVYFNAPAPIHSTLNRRNPLKSSVSTSSTGDNSTASLHRSARPIGNEVQMSSTMRNFAGNQNHYQQAPPKLAATIRDSLILNGPTPDNRYSTGLTLTSNVPIINGTHNSRINLDQQQQQHYQALNRQQQYRFNRDQQTFNSSQLRNEHIYDDIIYNQIIL